MKRPSKTRRHQPLRRERDKRKKNAEDILKKLKDIQTTHPLRQRALKTSMIRKSGSATSARGNREAVSAKAPPPASPVSSIPREGIGGPVFLYTNGDNDSPTPS